MSLSAIELVAIVDDDPFVRAATSSLVRSFGWEARAFGSAQEFLASGVPRCTHCLVCDIQMPAMDGIELLERLAHEGLRVPTVLITAFATARTRERAAASTALCLIEKPIDAAELERWIACAMGQGKPS